jgi:phosphate:Na+ symporter
VNAAWQSLSLLAGGLGLFLLGMGMMTDGLKQAAGQALHNILASATRTRWHALGSGALVTTMVQSSSAVTVATIGFINAGLLGLAPALWVLFGANIGSTMTGWLVALVGLKFKIEAFALPLVGMGMLMRLTGASQRRGAIGTAVAGFGLLFLGIGLLQESFNGIAGQIALPQGDDALTVLAQVVIGMLMTVLMQSSAASMAIALTAAQGGLLDAQGAAAVVIGANIGTTVTALLAAIGATPNARRAAAAHVIFNLITASVALALLPWLIGALASAREALGLSADPAAMLALFHTTFNVLGVALMWPLADGLTRWLLQRFRAREEDEAQPRYLDDNVLAVPALALDALEREVARFGQLCVRIAGAVLTGAAPVALVGDRTAMTQLDAAVESFVERLSRSTLSKAASERLAELLRIHRYFKTCADQAQTAAPLRAPEDPSLAAHQQAFVAALQRLFALHDTGPEANGGTPEVDGVPMELAYQNLKAAVLVAAAAGALPLSRMETSLGQYSALRRAAQQAAKAREHLHLKRAA